MSLSKFVLSHKIIARSQSVRVPTDLRGVSLNGNLILALLGMPPEERPSLSGAIVRGDGNFFRKDLLAFLQLAQQDGLDLSKATLVDTVFNEAINAVIASMSPNYRPIFCNPRVILSAQDPLRIVGRFEFGSHGDLTRFLCLVDGADLSGTILNITSFDDEFFLGSDQLREFKDETLRLLRASLTGNQFPPTLQLGPNLFQRLADLFQGGDKVRLMQSVLQSRTRYNSFQLKWDQANYLTFGLSWMDPILHSIAEEAAIPYLLFGKRTRVNDIRTLSPQRPNQLIFYVYEDERKDRFLSFYTPDQINEARGVEGLEMFRSWSPTYAYTVEFFVDKARFELVKALEEALGM